MKIFLDTADINEIKKAQETGILDGVTTNPTLASKTGKSFLEIAKELLDLNIGDVSLEVVASDYNGMIAEAEKLAGLGKGVVVKVPMTPAGVRAVKELSAKGIKTNITLVFSAAQALVAAKAGASYVSPFIGRLHDIGYDGLELISSIRTIFDNYGYSTEILAASDRTLLDTVQVAEIGADVITMKPENFWRLFEHPLTKIGLEKFNADWQQSGLSLDK